MGSWPVRTSAAVAVVLVAAALLVTRPRVAAPELVLDRATPGGAHVMGWLRPAKSGGTASCADESYLSLEASRGDQAVGTDDAVPGPALVSSDMKTAVRVIELDEADDVLLLVNAAPSMTVEALVGEGVVDSMTTTRGGWAVLAVRGSTWTVQSASNADQRSTVRSGATVKQTCLLRRP